MTTQDRLAKLYVEITTACNLDCLMCVRRVWQEPIGTMPLDSFRALLAQISDLPAPPTLHLGGYGEPLFHPDFLEIVRLAKAAGLRVEVTTNGTLLNAATAQALIDLDLDRLMVSFDGVRPESYNDIREGSNFTEVYDNLRQLRRLKLRQGSKHSNPQVGIAFVVMKSNMADLPELPWLATRLGAWEVQVSNLVPHSPEMEAEIVYERALQACAYRASHDVAEVRLPKLDYNDSTTGPIKDLYNSTASITLLDTSLSARNDYCKFAQEGYAVVRWDGAVSPCLSLLHDHPEYLHGRQRQVTHYTVGNVNEQSLAEIWESEEYSTFRAGLRDFSYSPCTTCGGCDRFPANYLDCTEHTFPTCGACLWAQGFIQCP